MVIQTKSNGVAIIRLVVSAVFLACFLAAAHGQVTSTTVPGITTTTLFGSTTTTVPGTTTTSIPTVQYTPYSPSEFPDWANKLRRGEIIAIGAFPLSFLFTGIIYDVARYINLYATNNPNASLYAPLFFAPSNKPAYTYDENIHLIISSAAVAVGIALLDFIIGEIQSASDRDKKAIVPVPVRAPDPEKLPPPPNNASQ